MRRELLAITADLLRESAAGAGWERVSQWYDEDRGVLVKWRNANDRREAITNDPEPLPAPFRYAIRARVMATLLHECPRCGASAAEQDPEALTSLELDRAQVTTVPTIQTFDVALEDVAGAAVEQAGEAVHLVLLHDRDCEAAPVNLYELGQAGWN